MSLYLYTSDIGIEFFLNDNVTEIKAGEKYSGLITLNTYMPLENGHTFTIRKDGRTLATGIITEIKD
ncbi:elongation factor Tu [compost metagenome]